MNREDMLTALIEADAMAVYEMDAEDQWQAIVGLIQAAYENISEAELQARYANLNEGD